MGARILAGGVPPVAGGSQRRGGRTALIEQKVTPSVLIALHAVKTLDGLGVPTMLPVTCRAVEQPGSSSGS